jgi:hypothetical protein
VIAGIVALGVALQRWHELPVTTRES